MASLSLKNVCKVYPNGFVAVKDFNLEIADQEFIIFVGPSGCGKSLSLIHIWEYAVNGGFAAINQMYASTLKDVKFINREEDINIPGLRKAKESYHPKFMLKKYGVRVK